MVKSVFTCEGCERSYNYLSDAELCEKTNQKIIGDCFIFKVSNKLELFSEPKIYRHKVVYKVRPITSLTLNYPFYCYYSPIEDHYKLPNPATEEFQEILALAKYRGFDPKIYYNEEAISIEEYKAIIDFYDKLPRSPQTESSTVKL